jgi:hypothetical protein
MAKSIWLTEILIFRKWEYFAVFIGLQIYFHCTIEPVGFHCFIMAVFTTPCRYSCAN